MLQPLKLAPFAHVLQNYFAVFRLRISIYDIHLDLAGMGLTNNGWQDICGHTPPRNLFELHGMTLS